MGQDWRTQKRKAKSVSCRTQEEKKMIVSSEVIDLITKVGFPIFVCLWFMVRTEKVIKNNTAALEQVKMILNKKSRR